MMSDAVAGQGFGEQRFADRRALRDMLGMPPAPLIASASQSEPRDPLDRAALVDRVGQVEPVVGAPCRAAKLSASSSPILASGP